MTALVLDFGNSKVKFGIFKEQEILFQDARPSLGATSLDILIHEFKITAAILSATRQMTPEVNTVLEKLPYFIELSHQTPLPIRIGYETPETLGKDRIAAAVGARALWPNEASLAIDAGTCITYDLVDETGTYLGGQITPGLYMRFKAMHTFTGRLPQVDHAVEPPEIGYSTISSMQSGVQRGIAYEMDGFIAAYKRRYPALKVVLTGGDASVLRSLIESEIFADSNLVLTGLHKILIHNAQLAE